MFSESDADINRQAGALRTSFITVKVRASTWVCWLTFFFMFHMFFKLAMLLGLAATLPVLDKTDSPCGSCRYNAMPRVS